MEKIKILLKTYLFMSTEYWPYLCFSTIFKGEFDVVVRTGGSRAWRVMFLRVTEVEDNLRAVSARTYFTKFR